ncbi:MAG: hypothetical protein PVH84_14280 [Candidatus Aminicenantes bacterium]|jgi:hypothetical protein
MAKNNERLVGIKAIAQYLDMSVRNVYYWEKNLGLPLHRVSSSGGYRIYATKRELDKWLITKDINTFKKDKLKKTILLTHIPIIVVLVVLFFFIQTRKNRPSAPQNISCDNNIIFVKDSMGKLLWEVGLNNKIDESSMNLFVDLDDIDEDSCNEVIACTYDMSQDDHFVTLFDNDGTILWKRTVSTDQTFNNIEINNYYRPGPVRFAKTNSGEILIVSKWNHMERFLSIIASHDLGGKLVSQYLHTGNLTSTMELIDINRDGEKELLFTGTNNLLNGEGILGVLSLSDFHGINPPYRIEPEYSHLEFRLKSYIPDEIIQGNEVLYIRFTKLPHLESYSVLYNNTEISYFSEDLIHIRLFPWRLAAGKPVFGVDYLFDGNFVLRQVIPQTILTQRYPDFLSRGDIKLSLEELLDIYSKNVLRWEKDGWIPIERNAID